MRQPPRPAPPLGPAFDQPVPPGGYLWWYLDGLSADRRHGITVIAFVGSVFSPYYAWSGRRSPENHVAVNVALYGDRPRRWAMTERGKSSLERSATRFRVGPSALRWDQGALEIRLDEICAPIPRRLRGTIRLTPAFHPGQSWCLDHQGRHFWQPIAPKATISVRLDWPELDWQGDAYLDSNFGSEPLETGFSDWSWARAHSGESTVVLYDALTRRDGTGSMALRFNPSGRVESLTPPPPTALPKGLWQMTRPARADAGSKSRVAWVLEDTPFYTRSLLETSLFGTPSLAFHESLDLDRFSAPWVRMLLPFRMPRQIW